MGGLEVVEEPQEEDVGLLVVLVAQFEEHAAENVVENFAGLVRLRQGLKVEDWVQFEEHRTQKSRVTDLEDASNSAAEQEESRVLMGLIKDVELVVPDEVVFEGLKPFRDGGANLEDVAIDA